MQQNDDEDGLIQPHAERSDSFHPTSEAVSAAMIATDEHPLNTIRFLEQFHGHSVTGRGAAAELHMPS